MSTNIDKSASAREKIKRLEDSVREKFPESELKPHKTPKSQRVWEVAGNFVKRVLDDRFFRIGLIEVLSGKKVQFVQPILIQEAKHFNEAECDKITGESILPVRRSVRGQIEAALTANFCVGAYGKPLITAPRHSLSNPKKILQNLAPENTLAEEWVRLDGNRLTGKTRCKIVKADENFPGAEEENEMMLQWFDEDELEVLLDEKLLEDAATLNLIKELLRKRKLISAALKTDL